MIETQKAGLCWKPEVKKQAVGCQTGGKICRSWKNNSIFIARKEMWDVIAFFPEIRVGAEILPHILTIPF